MWISFDELTVCLDGLQSDDFPLSPPFPTILGKGRYPGDTNANLALIPYLRLHRKCNPSVKIIIVLDCISHYWTVYVKLFFIHIAEYKTDMILKKKVMKILFTITNR